MEEHFWVTKWKNNEIGFHQSAANPLLVKHFNDLSLDKGSRVFIPLCGKTLDIKWLLSQGYQIVGAELVEDAIEQLFVDLEIEPNISKINNMLHYSAQNIDIFVGNIFDLSSEIIGKTDAIYDRAALVALTKKMRERYTAHIITMTNKAPQLLISYVYNQNLIAGPPFSIADEEVIQHYDGTYKLTRLESVEIVGGLKGKCAATEHVWLLQ